MNLADRNGPAYGLTDARRSWRRAGTGRWLLCGGGGGVADGQPCGAVAEVGDQVEAPSQGFHVPGDDLEGGHLAVLDMGHAGGAYARRGGDVFPREAQLLAGLGELVPAARASSSRAPASISAGETPAACSSRSRVPSPAGCAADPRSSVISVVNHAAYSSVTRAPDNSVAASWHAHWRQDTDLSRLATPGTGFARPYRRARAARRAGSLDKGGLCGESSGRIRRQNGAHRRVAPAVRRRWKWHARPLVAGASSGFWLH
jgi:hypothetical protein